MTGRDLASEPDDLPGRAMMHTKIINAWMKGGSRGVTAGKGLAHGYYDTVTKHLEVKARNLIAVAHRHSVR